MYANVSKYFKEYPNDIIPNVFILYIQIYPNISKCIQMCYFGTQICLNHHLGF